MTNWAAGLMAAQRPAPMSALIPSVIKAVLALEIGQGVELPKTARRPCNWSYEINNHLASNDSTVRVKQETVNGVTTAWRIE